MFASATSSMKLFYMSTDYTASNIIPLPLIRTGQRVNLHSCTQNLSLTSCVALESREQDKGNIATAEPKI